MLFVGDDWSEAHHDVEVFDDDGRRLAAARLPEGLDGITRLHALVARFVPAQWAELDPVEAASRVRIGIETDRGPWVAALVAAGYEVFAINPLSVARYREWHSTSGAKSDAADAHVLAEIVRLDRAHHRPITGDTPCSQAMKLVARSHQGLIWDRTRHVLRLRSALREYFPAALVALEDLYGPDALELLGRAPDPDRAARLPAAKISAVLRRANRRKITERTEQIQSTLRAPALRQPPAVQAAFAVIAAGEINVISTLNTEIATLGEVVAEHFGRHPDAEIYASQPGLGRHPQRPGPRRVRRRSPPLRRRARTQELRRHLADHPRVRNEEGRARAVRPQRQTGRLGPAMGDVIASRLTRRAKLLRRDAGTKIGHEAALRQLANRLIGILHGCLKTRTLYDVSIDWTHHIPAAA